MTTGSVNWKGQAGVISLVFENWLAALISKISAAGRAVLGTVDFGSGSGSKTVKSVL